MWEVCGFWHMWEDLWVSVYLSGFLGFHTWVRFQGFLVYVRGFVGFGVWVRGFVGFGIYGIFCSVKMTSMLWWNIPLFDHLCLKTFNGLLYLPTRYDQVGCCYLYDIDAHLDTSGSRGLSKPFVIGAIQVWKHSLHYQSQVKKFTFCHLSPLSAFIWISSLSTCLSPSLSLSLFCCLSCLISFGGPKLQVPSHWQLWVKKGQNKLTPAILQNCGL